MRGGNCESDSESASTWLKFAPGGAEEPQEAPESPGTHVYTNTANSPITLYG